MELLPRVLGLAVVGVMNGKRFSRSGRDCREAEADVLLETKIEGGEPVLARVGVLGHDCTGVECRLGD